jgi:hypothetical protein
MKVIDAKHSEENGRAIVSLTHGETHAAASVLLLRE